MCINEMCKVVGPLGWTPEEAWEGWNRLMDPERTRTWREPEEPN